MFYTARQLLTTDRLLLMVVGPRFGQLGLGSHLLGKSQDGVAQWVQGTRGLAMGGHDPGYPRQITWVAPLGAASPKKRSLAGHDAARRLPQDTGKIS